MPELSFKNQCMKTPPQRTTVKAQAARCLYYRPGQEQEELYGLDEGAN